MEETAEIAFYNILKKKFSEEDASKLVALQKQMYAVNLATKADLTQTESQIKTNLAQPESQLKTDLAQTESRIKTTLTWRIFAFWLTQVGVFLAFAYRIFPGM
ncbi:MAG: hypothetical protein AAF944_02050 [Bacteroidota bacterium]